MLDFFNIREISGPKHAPSAGFEIRARHFDRIAVFDHAVLSFGLAQVLIFAPGYRIFHSATFFKITLGEKNTPPKEEFLKKRLFLIFWEAMPCFLRQDQGFSAFSENCIFHFQWGDWNLLWTQLWVWRAPRSMGRIPNVFRGFRHF